MFQMLDMNEILSSWSREQNIRAHFTKDAQSVDNL